MDYDNLKNAIYKKAIGYNTTETTEEFALTDASNNKLELVKKKVSVKHMPPDVSAAKLLLELNTNTDDYSDFTDEQLASEKTRLLNELKELEEKKTK